jgi:hypothetical protein
MARVRRSGVGGAAAEGEGGVADVLVGHARVAGVELLALGGALVDPRRAVARRAVSPEAHGVGAALVHPLVVVPRPLPRWVRRQVSGWGQRGGGWRGP